MASPLSVLTRYRDFRRLFGAELVMFGGDWFVMIPLLGLLHQLTGHGLYGSLTLATDTGIGALMLPYTGTVADRLDRRKIMVVANLSALAAVGLLFTVRSASTAWLGPVAVGALALAKSFYTPSVQAAIPNVVDRDDLSAASAVSGSAWGTMSVLGASLGGVLATVVSPYTCFAATAVALITSAVLVVGVRVPLQAVRTGQASHPPALRAIGQSLSYLRRTPRVRALVTVKSAVGLGNGVLAAYPVLAVVYGMGNLGTGLLFAVRGAGALVGPFLLRGVLRRPRRLFGGLALSMAVYGAGYLGVAAVSWFPLVLVLIMLAHMAGGGNWAMSNAALQAEVPDELRGRVFATDLMLATIAVSVSQLTVGLVIDHTSTRWVVAASGAVTLLYSVAWRLATARLAGAPARLAEPAVAEDGPRQLAAVEPGAEPA